MPTSAPPRHALRLPSGVSNPRLLQKSPLRVPSGGYRRIGINIYETVVTVLRLKPDPGDYARSLRAVSDVLKGTFISEICWTIAICIVKCSILTFYWRLFRLQGGAIRIAIWAFFVVVVCWGIAVVRLASLGHPCLLKYTHPSVDLS